MPIVRCNDLQESLTQLRKHQFELCALDAEGEESLFDYQEPLRSVYVLGNETDGLDPGIAKQADTTLFIPMNSRVESLNVAITAALVAFKQNS